MITALWDIDGTLVQSPSTRMDLWPKAITALGAEPVVPSGSAEGFTDRRLAKMHLRAAGLDPDRADELLRVVDELSEQFYPGNPREPVPGAHQALALTSAYGWRNGLLTGNTPRRARVKLTTSGFNSDLINWALFASGGYVTDRAELGRRARSLAGDGPLVVFGDTAQDALAADAAGAAFVAVNTDPVRLAALADSAVLALTSLADAEFVAFVQEYTG